MGAKAISLQKRDLRFLTELNEVGVMDTPTIHGRYFPADRTGKASLRRLRSFVGHDLIRRLPLGVAYADQHVGKFPCVYCLTTRGGELLHELTGLDRVRVLRKDPRSETIQH